LPLTPDRVKAATTGNMATPAASPAAMATPAS